MTHYPGHLLLSIAALAATLVVSRVSINRVVKRKLKLSVFLFAVYAAVNLVVALRPDIVGPGHEAADAQLRAFERLGFAGALINLLVITLVNPLRVDRVADRVPTILQDAIVMGLLLLVSTFVFEEKLLTTSAVSAVVIGFALQDTLGNAFAGLAIQSERPFHVGDWIRVSDFEGRVAEVTWRATKLRTRTGNFVILPNNLVSKEAITNFSAPVVPSRLEVDVGASYGAVPNEVKAAIDEAMAQAPLVLEDPRPDVMLVAFADSAVTYRARFWVSDYEMDDEARDQVRAAIYYAFSRRGIDIPFPIQVQYDMDPPETDQASRIAEREDVLRGVDLFAALSDDQRRVIATAARSRLYGNGETMVRQGEAGHSMFIVCSGRANVLLDPDRRPVATIERGGYFGEMSLLTGDARTATVVAMGDTLVLEIDAELFRRLAVETPHAIEQIGVAAMTRRAELDQVRQSARGAAVADAPATFMSRMKKFLRFGQGA
jgi:small-conductance mechanosensitive channel/CRP-like cAMP-binding protein